MILDILAAVGLLAILAICVHGLRTARVRKGFLLMGGVTVLALAALVADPLLDSGPLHGARLGALILGALGLINGALVLAQIVSGKPWKPRRPRL
ncbi:hypothetical protein [Nitrospirillum iridis]|uniref:Uncharacterized protein n=1 Tax=Nitrospirillum iridis TaxID=765888 RepID=A0A7X0B174_9PROT|nr:hypothetical protein [Nitrospirillum iridis]MBB6252805.1 hypothetical protein [Nitrospirillum iridis]